MESTPSWEEPGASGSRTVGHRFRSRPVWCRDRSRRDDRAWPAYRDLLAEDESFGDEFADTPSAEEVPAAFDALYAAATAPLAAGVPCQAVDVLAYFAGLTDKAAAKVVGQAKEQYPGAMLDCALSQLRDGQASTSITTLDRFIRTFPDHGDLPQAQSARIAAQVAIGTDAQVQVPAPLGTGGPITITFYNTVNSSITIKLAGSTAHEFTLPPCTTCPESHAPGTGADACNSPAGAAPVRRRPG
ncbi:hypothetical protein EDD40_2463 [Saccharothrix texasensis]|uniref:Uncharacterized protein n=1 Tax=Saccharothrix texasensis TaxID=103734 RepID=A0A3N1H3S6_9PSEU|nr:hypothetical protein EDD40_2463 [Saccharothrix texasensis]